MNLLLDLDGTLSNPREGIVRCIQHALSAMGFAVPEGASLERFIGPPLRDAFQELLPPEAGDQSIETAVSLYRDRFAHVGIYENEIYPGVRPSLEQLCLGDNRLFLATSKPRVYALEILRHFGLSEYFEAVYGSELDGRNSEKSALVRLALTESQLLPQDSAMIGDRYHDMRGAVANDVLPVGVLWGFGTRAELESAGAKHMLADPAELGQLSSIDSHAGRKPE